MFVKNSDLSRTIGLFNKESVGKLNELRMKDVKEYRMKLKDALTPYFQDRVSMANPIIPTVEIAKSFGVDEELVKNIENAILKGATGPSDAPDLMNINKPVISAYFDKSILDPINLYGYEQCYNFVDMRGAGQTYFDIIDIDNAITFDEIKSGERMRVYGISDTKSTVNKMGKGAGIGILDDWLNYQQFWNLNRAVAEAKSKYYYTMGYDHFALIEAGSNTQAFSVSDIGTINTAIYNILNDCKALGFQLTGNEEFVLVANIALKERIQKAIALTYNSPVSLTANVPNQLISVVTPIYTLLTSVTYYYVILPGRKMQRAIWQDLGIEEDRDASIRGTDVYYYGEYNMAIGTASQVKKCSLS